MAKSDPQAQKAFISYSWTSQAHEEWVIGLATGLQESGVDVILDKWDLREGADKYTFMEKMVTDPSVKKVVCRMRSPLCRKSRWAGGGSN